MQPPPTPLRSPVMRWNTGYRWKLHAFTVDLHCSLICHSPFQATTTQVVSSLNMLVKGQAITGLRAHQTVLMHSQQPLCFQTAPWHSNYSQSQDMRALTWKFVGELPSPHMCMQSFNLARVKES